MRYTIPFAVILYAISATIDAYQGITTLNPTISYTFRIASATAIAATAIHILNRNKPLRALPFIIASLALSIAALLLGHTTPTTLTNTAIKTTATILALKPEIIKIDIVTEDREESNRSTRLDTERSRGVAGKHTHFQKGDCLSTVVVFRRYLMKSSLADLSVICQRISRKC